MGGDFNSVLVVMLNRDIPRVLGRFGAVFASLLLVAIMAASMSTADSNLHALSAVLTRDVYDQYVRPQARETERVWVGRAIIVAATVLSLLLVIAGSNPQVQARYDFLSMIALMGLMAIAFSAQLLPIAIDILFLRRGTARGAAAGLAAGIFGAFLFGPLFALIVEGLGSPAPLAAVLDFVNALKFTPMHGSVWGLVLNVPIFVLVSWFTRPVPLERRAEYARIME
jgi:Na+/proline symporter